MVRTLGIGTYMTMDFMRMLFQPLAIAFGGIGALTPSVLVGASASVLPIMPVATGVAGMAATGVAAGVVAGFIIITDITPDGVEAVTIRVGVVEVTGIATECIRTVAHQVALIRTVVQNILPEDKREDLYVVELQVTGV